MLILAVVAAVVAALFHLVFFVLESVLFSRPTVWRRFGVASQEHADAIRLMATNQGAYNLFLAIGALVGAVLLVAGDATVGAVLVGFAAACMVGAGLVLAGTGGRRLLRAAVLQAVPPLVALIALIAA